MPAAILEELVSIEEMESIKEMEVSLIMDPEKHKAIQQKNSFEDNINALNLIPLIIEELGKLQQVKTNDSEEEAKITEQKDLFEEYELIKEEDQSNLFYYEITKEGKVFILTFSTKSPQCTNYDGFQKVDCENEKKTFNLDVLVDHIFRTIKSVF